MSRTGQTNVRLVNLTPVPRAMRRRWIGDLASMGVPGGMLRSLGMSGPMTLQVKGRMSNRFGGSRGFCCSCNAMRSMKSTSGSMTRKPSEYEIVEADGGSGIGRGAPPPRGVGCMWSRSVVLNGGFGAKCGAE